MPSKSRKGWNVMVRNPRPSIMRRTSAGVPLNDNRSFSNISTPLKPAAAIASSFSFRTPLRQTVAIAVCISTSEPLGRHGDERREEHHQEQNDQLRDHEGPYSLDDVLHADARHPADDIQHDTHRGRYQADGVVDDEQNAEIDRVDAC